MAVDLINDRTPEEIKRWLRWATYRCEQTEDRCATCEYRDDCGEYCGSDTYKEALALIEHLESERDAALEKVPKWISVKERLPEHEHEVLVYTDRYGGRTEFAYYVRHLEAWYQNCCLLIPNVTHWMPLPEPPKEDE